MVNTLLSSCLCFHSGSPLQKCSIIQLVMILKVRKRNEWYVYSKSPMTTSAPPLHTPTPIPGGLNIKPNSFR